MIAAVAAATLAAAASAVPALAQEPLTLAEAVARAATSAAPVELAEIRVEGAEAAVRQARSALLPTFTATAGILNRSFNRRSLGIEFPAPPGGSAPPDRVRPFDNYDARIRMQQTLFDLASWSRLDAARSGLVPLDAEREAAAETAAHQAALAYIRAARAQALVSAREDDLALAESLVTLAEAQVEAGIGTAIDVTRARTQRASAEGLLVIARNESERALMELARAMGEDPTTRFALADSLGDGLASSGAPEDAEAAIAVAFQRRADLAAEAARGQSAEAARNAIRAERLPRLDLVADYGANGLTARDVLPTHQVGVQLTLPITDGLGRGARIAQQEAALRASHVAERELRERITAEVLSARLELASGLEQRRIAAERVSLAAAEIAQAIERFESGVAGNTEVINAQASMIAARTADIDASVAIAVARAALAKATGVARSLR